MGTPLHVTIATDIDAPAEIVWSVLAHRFADIASWSTIVETSRPLSEAIVGGAAR